MNTPLNPETAFPLIGAAPALPLITSVTTESGKLIFNDRSFRLRDICYFELSFSPQSKKIANLYISVHELNSQNAMMATPIVTKPLGSIDMGGEAMQSLRQKAIDLDLTIIEYPFEGHDPSEYFEKTKTPWQRFLNDWGGIIFWVALLGGCVIASNNPSKEEPKAQPIRTQPLAPKP